MLQTLDKRTFLSIGAQKRSIGALPAPYTSLVVLCLWSCYHVSGLGVPYVPLDTSSSTTGGMCTTG